MADNKVQQIIEIITRGAKKSEQEVKGVSNGLKNLAKQAAIAAGAYLGARGLLSGVQKSIDLFAQQELAEKKLRFAAGASTTQLIKQAKALQQSTRFGDEALIAQQAYVKSLGISTEQTKEIIAASVDLAAAMGISLESAVMNTTKTLSGMQGELGEKLPAAFKELTAEQLKAGEGIEFIRNQFRGTAEEEAETLTGALEQMKNAMGDAGEEIGNFLSPAIEKSAGFFKSASESVGSFFRSLTETELETTIRLLEDLNVESESLIKLKNLQIDSEIKKLNIELQKSNKEGLTAEQIEARLEAIQQERIKNTEELGVIMGSTTEQERKILRLKERGLDVGLQGMQYGASAEAIVKRTKEVNEQQLEIQKQTGDFQKQTLENLTDEETRLLELIAPITEINLLKAQKLKIEDKIQKTENNNLDNNIKKEKILAKLRKEENRDVAIAEIQAAASSAKANLINQIMKAVPFPFNLVAAAGAGKTIDKLYSKLLTPITAQYGADFITDGPQMMMVGEGSGPERVQVTPLVDENRDGPQGQGITLNISGNVLHDSFVEDSVVPQIREALRMGENLGA